MPKLSADLAVNPDSSHNRPSGESVNLDVLRSIAVLMVFVAHYFDIQDGVGRKWGFAWHTGAVGVLIFFVHTCLVLMWSLERTDHPGWHIFIPFYVRRAMRIYPLSIAFVLFAYVFDARWIPPNLWQSLTLTQYMFFKGPQPRFPSLVAPLWSLPLEIEMYLVLPCLYLLLRNRPIFYSVMTWAASVVFAVMQPRFGEGYAILRYVPCFLGGVLAWRLMRTRNYRRLPGWVWPIAIAVISSTWLASIPATYELSIALFGICLGLVIPLFREIRGAKVTLAAKLVARYSYGIYLSHFPIMIYVMGDSSWPERWFKIIPRMPHIAHYARPINIVLVTGLTAGVSVLLYHGIEKPGIQLGRRMAEWLARPSRERILVPAE